MSGHRWWRAFWRALLRRPALTIYRDADGRDVGYDVRPQLLGPAFYTSSRAEALRLLSEEDG